MKYPIIASIIALISGGSAAAYSYPSDPAIPPVPMLNSMPAVAA